MVQMEASLLVLEVCLLFTSTLAIRQDHGHHRHGLSDLDHDAGGHHNADYDHEAFLGKADKITFDQLSPDESKRRLAVIVRKIDEDGDGFVSEAELEARIAAMQRVWMASDSQRTWDSHHTDPDGTLPWAAYQRRAYGHDDDPNEFGSKTSKYAVKINRDRRRFDVADVDTDGRLSRDEFTDFTHPTGAKHMHHVYITESLEDIDKNNDGFIDEEEYIADMWPDKQFASEEPDWIAVQRKEFRKQKDKNGDGKLDHGEVKDWFLPDDFTDAKAEAKHLISEADQNKDGQLSHAEILGKYDLFVGSHATEYGESLVRHDEF